MRRRQKVGYRMAFFFVFFIYHSILLLLFTTCIYLDGCYVLMFFLYIYTCGLHFQGARSFIFYPVPYIPYM